MTMKGLYFLVLVSFCQGLPLETSVVKLPPAPNDVMVTTLDPPAIEVSWNKVDSGDAEAPVLGYKVKLWEVKKIKITKYTFVDGELKKIEEEQDEPIKPSGPSGIPEEVQTPADVITTTFRNIKLDVFYEVRINAFSKNGDGRASSAFRVKLNSE